MTTAARTESMLSQLWNTPPKHEWEYHQHQAVVDYIYFVCIAARECHHLRRAWVLGAHVAGIFILIASALAGAEAAYFAGIASVLAPWAFYEWCAHRQLGRDCRVAAAALERAFGRAHVHDVLRQVDEARPLPTLGRTKPQVCTIPFHPETTRNASAAWAQALDDYRDYR